MNLIKLSGGFLIALTIAFSGQHAFGQESESQNVAAANLAAAKAISAASGRPIFAIAGRST